MNPTLVHAIVGCGRVAPCHADAFLRIPGVTIKYAVAKHTATAKAFAEANGIPSAVSLEQALDDPEVSSVSIATPHDSHIDVALAAIKRGKHVLIEKPVAIHVTDIERLIELSLAPTAPLIMPVAQHRFDRPIQIVAGLVRDGYLGKLVLVRAHLECFRPKEYYTNSSWRGRWEREGGSVLINQAYHILDLIVWLAGDVSGATADMHHMLYSGCLETEEALTASLRFSSGAVGSISVSGSAGSTWHSSIEIIGENGVVGFNIGYPPAVYRIDLKDRRAGIVARQALKASEQPQSIPRAVPDYYGTAHRDQAAAFVRTIRDGYTDPNAATLQDSLKVVSVAKTCYASVRSKG